MEKYQQKFIEEAKELLGKLESSLLELEQNPAKASLINEIFRIMHSLKGSGAMFGFTRISSFTHDLETIYSAIRSGQLMVSKHLIDISFQSLDLIRELLKGSESSKELSQIKELSKQIQIILSHKKEEESAPIAVQLNEQKIEITSDNAECRLWLIRFIPHENILIEGNDPLYMFDELNAHGELLISPILSNLPELSIMNSSKLFIQWNMLLWADVELETIESVFLFVKDQSSIEISRLNSSSPTTSPEIQEQLRILLSNEDIDGPGIEKVLQTTKEESQVSPTSTKSFQDSQNLPPSKMEISESSEEILSEEISIRVSSKKIDDLMNLVRILAIPDTDSCLNRTLIPA